MNRRHFLKSVIAAGAAPTFIPAGILRAQDGKPTPSNRVTFALIGSGSMGNGGLGNVLANPDAQVIAACDVFKSRREKTAKRVDDHYKTTGCAAYGDFRELLARNDLDCVEIATGDYWHIPIALAAARAGKDMYVEKPLGISLDWAYVLRKEINDRKRIFQHGTWQRSSAHFRKACEMVSNGVIGKVRRVEAWTHGMASDVGGIFNEGSKLRQMHLDGLKGAPVPEELDYNMFLGPAPAKPFTAVRGTHHAIFHCSDYALGFIAGWGIHAVDIAQWALGMDHSAPVSYKGTGRLPDIFGLFDTLATWDVQCTYENGIEMHFMDAFTAKPVIEKYRPYCDHGTTFFGEKGWISVDRAAVYASEQEWKAWKIFDCGPNAKKLYESKNQWGNFIDCVKTRKPTINPIESAIIGDVICHLSDMAVRTGREIKWDPKAEKVIDDNEAQLLLSKTPRAPWKIEA